MKSKKRAWVGLAISLWIVFVCDHYFFSDYFVTESFTPRHNFLYCLPMFIGGELVYLYRNETSSICEKYRWLVLVGCITASFAWYFIPYESKSIFYIGTLMLYFLWLSYAIGSNSKFLSSKLMKFLSSISMEMYLAQMVIFRVVEKIHLLYLFGDTGIGGWMSFIFAFTLTVLGLIIFIECSKIIVKLWKQWKGVQCGKA